MRNEISEKYKLNKEDGILAANILDKDKICFEKSFVTATPFLSLSQQNLVNILKKDLRSQFILYGGYDNAERKALFFLPDYIDCTQIPEISDFRIFKAVGNKTLSHRDFLGSALALGLKRDSIGDIIVKENSAQFIVTEKIADFMKANYFKAGHTPLDTEILPINCIETGEIKTKIITDTVMSLRIDAVIACAFKISRTAAVREIQAGKVFVNDALITKTDFKTQPGSTLILRGKGKARLNTISGISKKGRMWIEIERYI